ncbi:hypothetical protein GDO78_002470 [Eleutherodactylus coqui]|uniref:Uncharacterized protein n=1 Tax=Eleutherodactylus coqui TaxID=57060 RepID=A0A8J6EYQ5_ELECQ|nr:hypothetical protein GDO78_002470 [Eleutherodactylus coqui]
MCMWTTRLSLMTDLKIQGLIISCLTLCPPLLLLNKLACQAECTCLWTGLRRGLSADHRLSAGLSLLYVDATLLCSWQTRI